MIVKPYPIVIHATGEIVNAKKGLMHQKITTLRQTLSEWTLEIYSGPRK